MIVCGFEFPDPLFYLVEHQMWARLEADGEVSIGITSLGIHLAGEIYMCRPKAVGSPVEQGRSIGVVELAKSIVSLKTPLSGVVTAVNPRLADQPEIVHLDPYGEGWIARLRPSRFEGEAAALVHRETVAAAMAEHARLHQAS